MEPEELSASMGSCASGSDSAEEELHTLSSNPAERHHKRRHPAVVLSGPESMRVTPAPEALAPLMKPLDQQGPDLVEEAESPHGSASGTRDSEVEGSSDVGSSDEDTEDERGQEDQEEEKDSERELGAGLGANANDSQDAQSPNFSLPSSDFLGDEHDGKWGMGRSTTTRVPCRQIASSDRDDSDNENFQGTRGKSVDELISRARSLIAQSSGLVSQGDIDSNINSDHHEQSMEEKGSTLQQSGVVDPKVQARQLGVNRDKHMTKKPSAHELNFGFTPSRCKRSRSPVKHLDDITSLVNNPHGPSSGLKQSQSSLRTLDQQRFSRVDSNVGLVRSASFGFTRSPSHQRTPTAARSLIKNPTHSSPRFGYVRSASAKHLLRRSDDV
uniref:Uncharacterized protein n=1 Tax=Heterosigma akashiwo TaxID=2829 RepID=A0A7S3XQS9_HETAK